MNEPGTVSTTVTGSGPPALLLHPGGYDSRFWAPSLPFLAGHLSTIVPDRPGHGSSIDEILLRRARASTPDEFRRLTADIRSATDEVERIESSLVSDGHTRLSVVGFGDGGLVALQIAARDAISIDAVVLVDTLVLPPENTDLDALLDKLDGAGFDPAGLASIMTTVLETRNPDPYVEWVMNRDDNRGLRAEQRNLVRSMVSDNAISALFTAESQLPGCLAPEALGVVAAPVLMIRAASDTSEDDTLASALPGTTVTIEHVRRAGPLYPLSSPAEFAERTVRFVSEGR